MAEGYVCCFCGSSIEQSDVNALELIATNLWEREAAQAIFAHSACAEERMAAGQLAPWALRDADNNYSLQEIVWGDDRAKRLPGWTCLVAIIVIVAGAYFLLR